MKKQLATDSFTMRISPKEKEMLADIAKHFLRSQANMLKALIHEAHRVLKEEQTKKGLR